MRLLKQTKHGIETLLIRKIAGICTICYADYRKAGGSLEEYELTIGKSLILCHYCAIRNINNIKKQPNTFELTDDIVREVKPLKLGPLAFIN